MLMVKDCVKHQDISGKEFIMEKEVELSTVISNAIFGNWACKNFLDRRKLNENEMSLKLYYGKVDNFGYIVVEDELQEV